MTNTFQLPTLPSDAFWEFSVALYDHTSVKTVCLNWQDDYNFNVNVVLYICWLAKTGRGRLKQNCLKTVLGGLEQWHKGVTSALRATRRLLGEHQQHNIARKVKNQIKDLELDAERMEQFILSQQFYRSPISDRPVLQRTLDVIAGVRAYAKIMQVNLGTKDMLALEKVLALLFPTMSENDIKICCNDT